MRASCRYPVGMVTFPGGFLLSPQGMTAAGYFDGSHLHCVASANTLEGGSLYQFHFADFDGVLSDEMQGEAARCVLFHYRLIPRGDAPRLPARAHVFAYDAGQHRLLPASRIVPLSPCAPAAPILDHAGRPIGHAFDTDAQSLVLRFAAPAGTGLEWFRPAPALCDELPLLDDQLALERDGTAFIPRGATGDFLVVCRPAEMTPALPRAGAGGDAPMIAAFPR
ncbi:MAG: hypothetical protein JO264_04810 [Acidisphaera sp.]|nr:hypothetical protein [Acidisphaera sp.]